MSVSANKAADGGGSIGLPADLEGRLYAFRGQVWRIKLLEAVAGAVVGVLVGYLVVLVLDRLMETPRGLRLAIFAGAAAACGVVPVALHRWIWRHRRLEQLARLIARSFPGMGDQLLGIIELSRERGAAGSPGFGGSPNGHGRSTSRGRYPVRGTGSGCWRRPFRLCSRPRQPGLSPRRPPMRGPDSWLLGVRPTASRSRGLSGFKRRSWCRVANRPACQCG